MDDNSDPTTAALNGDGSDTDWILNNGGAGNPYVQNQSAVDAVDNGLVSVNTSATGTTTATAAPANWATSLLNLAQTGAQDYSIVAPLVNGQAAPPANPAAATTASGTVAPASSSNLLLLIVAGVAAVFLLPKLFKAAR